MMERAPGSAKVGPKLALTEVILLVDGIKTSSAIANPGRLLGKRRSLAQLPQDLMAAVAPSHTVSSAAARLASRPASSRPLQAHTVSSHDREQRDGPRKRPAGSN